MIEHDIARFERALKRNPDYPPGFVSPPGIPGHQDEQSAWDRLTDRQRTRIETAFIDQHFDGDFLYNILDAVTDPQRVELIKKIQGLWRTHRAVELDL